MLWCCGVVCREGRKGLSGGNLLVLNVGKEKSRRVRRKVSAVSGEGRHPNEFARHGEILRGKEGGGWTRSEK